MPHDGLELESPQVSYGLIFDNRICLCKILDSCPCGEIGRRTSFRCWRLHGRAGSSPVVGTKDFIWKRDSENSRPFSISFSNYLFPIFRTRISSLIWPLTLLTFTNYFFNFVKITFNCNQNLVLLRAYFVFIQAITETSIEFCKISCYKLSLDFSTLGIRLFGTTNEF